MTAKEYVDHLWKVHNHSKDSPEADSTLRVAEYAQKFYDITNGERSGVLFFALPMIVGVMHESMEDYVEATRGTKLTTLEAEYVRSFRTKLLDIVAHLDEVVTDSFSADRPVEVYRDLDKDDA